MAGSLEIQLAKQGLAQQRSVRALIHLLESMPAEQRCKIRELCMLSNNVGIANMPDSQQCRICKALTGNLTTLRLHDVYLRMEALEAPGIELRLKVLDLSGSVLEAKANARVLVWPLLTSNSPTLRCLILKNVIVHTPQIAIGNIQDPPLEHVVLPKLEELDISHFGFSDYKPSGNKYFENRRAGLSLHYPSLPPQCFKGAPRLTTMRFSPPYQIIRRIRASTWEHFPNLCSVELNHDMWCDAPLSERLPLSLAELTVRARPPPHESEKGECLRVTEYFELIKKAASAGMRLHKLTLVGFTYDDVRRFAVKFESWRLCLAGIQELVLEPCLSDAVVVALDHVVKTHPADQMLHVFPDVKRLQIRGQHLACLTLTVPCPSLVELSLSFCPASISVDCANLRSLRLEHRFSTGLAQREAELHKLDISAWACGQLDSLIVVLGSYKEEDAFQAQCKPDTAMSATLSYSEEWGEWVIGLKLRAGTVKQKGQCAVKFVCTSSLGLLAWDLAESVSL